MNKYPHIFQRLDVKSLHLKNRIGMPPIGSNFAALDGSIREEHIDYYRRRAEGGVGLIIVENVCVDYPLGTNGTTQLRLDDDQYIPGIHKLTETLHRYNTGLSVQLNHAGSGAYLGRLNGADMVSASAVPAKKGMKCPRPLTVSEIEAITECFAQSARRAKQAGFDAVEIHAGHAYLLSQFLSPHYNQRTDAFGGTAENRARFPRMVLQAVRAAVGRDFTIGMRFSADEFVPDGNNLDDTLHTLEFLADEVDIFNVSAGLMDSIWYTMDKMELEEGWRAYMAGAVRRHFGKPVMTSGNIRHPEVAERILAQGDADIILIGRGHIADPDWVWKTRNGLSSDIRPCLSCNIGCCGNRMGGSRAIRCTVNPDVVGGSMPSGDAASLSVTVIGGGTAGLEAACTAAEMGCSVTLFEAQTNLGGLARSLAAIPAKKRLGDFPAWLERRASRLHNLTIKTGIRAGLTELNASAPDIVVVATGARPLLPPIPGLKKGLAEGTLKTVMDLLDDMDAYRSLTGRNIAIAGGGAVGLDVAEWCVKAGAASVSIVEMLPVVGKDLDLITRSSMLDMIEKAGINVHLSTRILSVDGGSFVVECPEGKTSLTFDLGFICLGMQADISRFEGVSDWCMKNEVEMLVVGDAKAGRRIIDGVREGRNVATLIQQTMRQRELVDVEQAPLSRLLP